MSPVLDTLISVLHDVNREQRSLFWQLVTSLLWALWSILPPELSGALCDAVPVSQTTWLATDDNMGPCFDPAVSKVPEVAIPV